MPSQRFAISYCTSVGVMLRASSSFAFACASARANQLLSQSITPNLVQYELTKKWNGQMPQVTGGATPLLQLPTATKP